MYGPMAGVWFDAQTCVLGLGVMYKAAPVVIYKALSSVAISSHSAS